MDKVNETFDHILANAPADSDIVSLTHALKNYLGPRASDVDLDLAEKDASISALKEDLQISKDTIVELRNSLYKCESRILNLEKYNSKSCLIFVNAPLTRDCDDILGSMIAFINDVFSVQIKREAVVACHPLGNFQNNTPPAIIVKFVHYWDKDIVYKRRSWLRGMKNYSNNGYMYINERLPEDCKNIFHEARRSDMKVSTENCSVFVEVKKPHGGISHQKVDTLRELQALKHIAVPRQVAKPRVQPTEPEVIPNSSLPSEHAQPATPRLPNREQGIKRHNGKDDEIDDDVEADIRSIMNIQSEDQAAAFLNALRGKSPLHKRTNNSKSPSDARYGVAHVS